MIQKATSIQTHTQNILVKTTRWYWPPHSLLHCFSFIVIPVLFILCTKMLDSLTHSRLNTAIHTPTSTNIHTRTHWVHVMMFFLFVIVIDRFVCVCCCCVVSCLGRSLAYVFVGVDACTCVRVFVRLFSRVSFGSFALLSMGFLIWLFNPQASSSSS